MRKSTVTCLSVALLLACVLGSTVTAQTITHYTNASHAQEWANHLNTMAKRFHATTGIHVNVVQSSGNYEEILLTMIAGGVPPDITDFHPGNAGTFLRADLFEDLQPYVDRGNIDINDYPPTSIEGVVSPNGKLWGFPVSVFPVVTFFNDDLFQSAGLLNPIDLGEDWTWETFRESSRRLTMDRSGDGRVDQWGVERLTNRWEQWVHQAGGRWFDRYVFPTESRFNSEEVHEAVRFLVELIIDDQILAPSGAQHTFRSGNGTVGMTTVDGPGIIGPFLQGISFKWDIARQPLGASNRSALVTPNPFQILKHSQNKDASWQWIEFLVGDPDNQYEFSMTTGRIPAHRDAMMRYGELPIDLPDNWMAFIETAFDPNSYTGYVIPSQINTTISQTMKQVWDGSMSPEEGLQQLHDVISSTLEQSSE